MTNSIVTILVLAKGKKGGMKKQRLIISVVIDAMFITQYIAGLRNLNASQLQCADIMDDGDVTMADAMHIAQWKADPDGTLGVLFKPLWESPADEDILKLVDSRIKN